MARMISLIVMGRNKVEYSTEFQSGKYAIWLNPDSVEYVEPAEFKDGILHRPQDGFAVLPNCFAVGLKSGTCFVIDTSLAVPMVRDMMGLADIFNKG